MPALYLKRLALPSLACALLLSGCDSPPPQTTERKDAVPNAYVEALQEAEALKHSVGERAHEQRRIDALLGREAAR